MRDSGEALNGCDTCGAQVRHDDRACPICGAPQVGRGTSAIPVRRFGVVPPYPEEEAEELLADDSPQPPRGRLRWWPLLLVAASAGLLAACARFFLE